MLQRHWPKSTQAILTSVVLGLALAPRVTVNAISVTDKVITNERAEQVTATQALTVDLYNGGIDGNGGFGAYLTRQNHESQNDSSQNNESQNDASHSDRTHVFNPDWNGFSHAFLNRDFSRLSVDFPARGMNHLIGQSRVIYINAETHRLLGTPNSRFREVAQQAADFLIASAWDDTYGGWYWGIEPDGTHPPLDNSPVYGPRAQEKDAYGQVHASLSLAKVYAITNERRYLDAALRGWSHFKAKHADVSAGSYIANFNRDYTSQPASTERKTRNCDYMLHAFETALALYDVTAGEVQESLRQDAYGIGQHIVDRMVQAEETSWTGTQYTRAFVPWFYTPNWTSLTYQPDSSSPDSSEAGLSATNTPKPNYIISGHQFEMALFLSRAVERGIGDQRWLTTANQLINHGLHYSYDSTRGTVNYSRLRLSADPYADGQDVTWWPQAEAARALAHFAIVRDRPELWDEFELTFNMIQNHLTDPVHGGWFHALDPATLLPLDPDKLKGQPWKVYYHATMLHAELVRLNHSKSIKRNLSRRKYSLAQPQR